MTAAPSVSPKQIGLFDAPVAAKTQVCAKCGQPRALKLFAWKDKRAGIREDICNTCRMSDFHSPAKPAAPPRSARERAIATPHPAGFIPTPPALWSKKGDVVRVLINDERTGLTLCVVGVVTGVKPTNKLVSGYQKLRNFLVRQGWQIAQIRGSIAAPLLERTAREGGRMASKAPSPHNASLVQRPSPVAHDYHPNDPVSTCRSNLAVRLYTQVKAGEDWQRWATQVGDQHLIAAVNEAVAALKRAHQIAAPKEYVERRKPKEGE